MKLQGAIVTLFVVAAVAAVATGWLRKC